ncbi:hypothetical protein B0T10DRAFT_594292 [Thelonectria olida]|uniref:Extracellular membrane protein CFEM domain-containing protein n=1 Tax=Thelonectria olida TaxID=1576542 RepID=A0A9P9ART7_9HYPO|nr:hypothetical protein B0T10DRAFT_594292 [Thelonectria olida]
MFSNALSPFLVLVLPIVTALSTSTDAPAPVGTSDRIPPIITSAVQLPAPLERRGAEEFETLAGYTRLLWCAQGCLAGGRDNVWNFAGCGKNVCVCRADRQPVVVQSLESCISANCGTGTVDIVGATSVFALFCSSVTGIEDYVVPTAGTEENAPVTATEFTTVTVVSSSSKPSSEFVVFLMMVSKLIWYTVLIIDTYSSYYRSGFFFIFNRRGNWEHIL